MRKILSLFMLLLLTAGFSAKAADEIYAVFNSSTKCITLYYDDQRASRGGVSGWMTEDWRKDVTSVIFDESMKKARPASTTEWFSGFTNLTEIQHLDYLNTSEVMSMNGMFNQCKKLESLDVSTFNTAKVTNMTSMFQYCSALTQLDLSSFNTSKVTSMSAMCSFCSELTTVELRSFDISSVTSLAGMFWACTKLTTINCNADWSTTTANTADMFGYCSKLPNYDSGKTNGEYARPNKSGQIGYFTEKAPEVYARYDAANTTMTLYYGFGSNTKWKSVFPYADITTVVLDESMKDARPTSTNNWFSDFTSLTEIQHLDYLNTSEVTDMSYMFWECSALTQLYLSSFNTAKVTDMSYMFAHCYKLETIELRSFDISSVTDLGGMFYWCSKLKTIRCNADWSTTTANASGMFGYCSSLPNYDAEKTNAEYARPYKDGQKGYFTEKEPVYAVYDAGTKTMTLHHGIGMITDWWDDLPSAEITTVVMDESMKDARPTRTLVWFSNFTNLTEIQHLDYLNTSEVTDMGYMFRGCKKLASLDLKTFNTSKVTDMYGMFDGCDNLASVDVRTFDVTKVTKMDRMFWGCHTLKTIYCGNDWSKTTATSTNMFQGCASIVGENGTLYDGGHLDASYARLDKAGEPGYFALVPGPEIYAVYDDATATMTLYYDNQIATKGGTTDWENDLSIEDVTTVVFDESMKAARPKSTSLWFNYFKRLRDIQHLDYLNTSEVTDMSAMFRNCEKLASVDLRTFDVTKVTNMNSMFYWCSELKTIYCAGDWSKTTATSTDMFTYCIAIVGGNGTVYDSEHVDATYARLDKAGAPGYFALEDGPEIYAVYNDASATMTIYFDNKRAEKGGIPQKKWDDLPYEEIMTVVFDEKIQNARPKSTSGWFYYFSRLREIQHLEYLNTSEVTNMSNMFRNCEKLTTLDLRSFDVTKVTTMNLMFYGCSALKTIYCDGDWSTTTASSTASSTNMFVGCTSLVGGNGTVYDSEHVDASYARLDKAGAPGYFTSSKAITDAKAQLKALIDDMNALYDFAAQYIPASELSSFKTAIEAAEGVYDNPASTLAEVNAAISVAQMTLDDGITTVMTEGKAALKDFVGDKLLPNDNAECKKIVKDAQDKIDALTWDDTKSVTENIAILDPAIKKILEDVDAALAAARSEMGVETIENGRLNDVQKVMRDGRLYIIRDGKMYNAVGAEVK